MLALLASVALFSFFALRALYALRPLRARRAGRALRPLRAGVALVAFIAFFSPLAFVALENAVRRVLVQLGDLGRAARDGRAQLFKKARRWLSGNPPFAVCAAGDTLRDRRLRCDDGSVRADTGHADLDDPGLGHQLPRNHTGVFAVEQDVIDGVSAPENGGFGEACPALVKGKLGAVVVDAPFDAQRRPLDFQLRLTDRKPQSVHQIRLPP